VKLFPLAAIFPFLWMPGPAVAQAPLSVYKRISIDQGLSQGQVNCMVKDRLGFVWLGTQDGLNRYDAYAFRQYYHRPGDTTSLSNNYIWSLFEDSRGDMWIGTFGGGLCRYDAKQERFQTYRPVAFAGKTVSENAIRSICEYPVGALLVGSDKGLWTFDLTARRFRPVHPSLATLLNIVALEPYSENEVLIGCAQGLFCWNTDRQVLTAVSFTDGQMPTVNAIAPGDAGAFWIGTPAGLFRLERRSTAGGVAVAEPVNLSGALQDHNILSLLTDVNDHLWVGTTSGLARIDGKYPDMEISTLTHTAGITASLSSDMVNSLLEPEPGLLLAGTREGINCIFAAPSPFSTLRFGENGRGLCANSILGMAEGASGTGWIATNEGLTMVQNFGSDPHAWQTRCIHPRNNPAIPYAYVLRVIPAGTDSLWVTFRRNGFALLIQKAPLEWYFSPVRQFDSILQGAGINAVYRDRRNITWLATPGQGLIRWDRIKGRHKVYTTENTGGALPHQYIFCLLEDSGGRFWVGTANGGLCLLDRDTGHFRAFLHMPDDDASISSNMILSLFEDSRQRLWVCTANGLNLYLGDGRFKRFSQKDGLPNEVVYGILEDAAGRLWMSTNRGLAYFEVRHDSIDLVQTYDAADGLQGNEFNQHSFYRTRDGRFCFGGTAGLTVFDPRNIKPYPVAPPVVITDFQLFNQSVKVGHTGGRQYALQYAIQATEEIVLRHDQNFIAFEFAALGYRQPENNLYAYRMVGVDAEWVESGSRRYAAYPRLLPGHYTFCVRAANHDGVWNDKPVSIRIHILPPWWQRWWAYALLATLIGGAVWVVFWQRIKAVRRMEQVKIEERERFRKRTALDFHDEAGNRITKIALLSEVVKNMVRDNTATLQLMEQMENNIQDLRNGMRDFIWVLDPENDNVYEMLTRLRDFANELFSWSETRFSAEGISPGFREMHLNSNQRRHILLIFKEAANNCVKYAHATRAKLRITVDADTLTIEFRDDGRGFDTEAVKTGNGLSNMTARTEKIGGKFSLDSAPGAGTIIRLVIQITQTGN
jgi:ligand-binding sensor domain-containing protein/signal transduction histidine kinase